MGIDKLIEICDNVASGDASFENVRCISEMLESILTHVKGFAEETNYSPVGYPIEYFNRNTDECNAAVEAFSNILEELESYFYD